MNPKLIIAKFAIDLIVSIAAGLLADTVVAKVKDKNFETWKEGFDWGRRYYEYENSK